MADHKLKTWIEDYCAVVSGRKRHEWRRDDRSPPYAVGDRLILEEFLPCDRCGATGYSEDFAHDEAGTRVRVSGSCCPAPHGVYTERSTIVFVTYVSRHPSHGIPAGWVVMSVDPGHDPRLDPQPGDHVTSVEGEKAEVLAILARADDCDPVLGPPPHVEARIDSRCGNRRRSVMSLESWRRTFASDPSGSMPPARNT